ncbi:V-type ATP synthase subunit D [Streptomyces sp. NBC_01233]|uniref:V-type ATP synthase subunit D n=1 Tax=Streptomyces sp. NBC_01233 TaxID=2903787 RepID=UPI002E0D4D3D|nr:V-type ATPase, D subunit [Streptomyces sp. NBC_01233]
MTGRHRVPPGRAGRLRLRRSLDTALRGADLLERKLQILLAREEELRRAEEEADHAWRQHLGEAETWLLRGLLLGGEQALASAVVADRAEATVEWTASMGVRHPSGVSWTPAARSPAEPTPGNTALVVAEGAYREAVRAAAEFAAARTAARLLAEETHRTRLRVRVLRRHWIPRMHRELAAADLALEQAEHEDSVRRHWAAGLRARREAVSARPAGGAKSGEEAP